ncbi:Protein kinase alk2 [Rhizina undulata]
MPSTVIQGGALLFITYIFISAILRIKKRFEHARFAREHGCLPPKEAPHSFPLNIQRLRDIVAANDANLLPVYFHNQQKLHGTTYKSCILGVDAIITSDAENVKALLATQFKDYVLGKERHNNFFPLLGDGIFTLDGKGWEHSRALLRPQFSKEQIMDVNSLETHVSRLLSIVLGKEDGVVELQELFFKLTMDNSTEFLFGTSTNSLMGEEETIAGEMGMSEAFSYAQEIMGIRVAFEKFWWLYSPKKLDKAVKIIHNFADKYVQVALNKQRDGLLKKEGEEEKYVFLEALAMETQDPKVLRDQVLNLLLAGRDTTASLLGWIFYFLARDERVWKKLREEVLNDFGKEKPTYQGMKDTVYLKWVINEALRLIPIVPLNARFAFRDTTLPRGGGLDGNAPVFVPKGTRILYNPFSLQRRTDIYGPDAEEFRPERWGEGKARGWEFVPFNGGPRICIGQNFALTTASYVVIRMMQYIERIENADPEERLLYLSALTVSSATGVKVKIFKDRAVD